MRILCMIILMVSCINPQQEKPVEFNPKQEKEAIHTFMNAWHQAAAVADEDVFFNSIKDGGIYLGTDKTERWTKEEFMDWGMKYFTERDTAWAFTPFDREIYFSENGQTAWFEEQLDTWMGNCRGSGVLQKDSINWQIAHYNLAVTIDNDLINGFIDLTGAKGK